MGNLLIRLKRKRRNGVASLVVDCLVSHRQDRTVGKGGWQAVDHKMEKGRYWGWFRNGLEVVVEGRDDEVVVEVVRNIVEVERTGTVGRVDVVEEGGVGKIEVVEEAVTS